MRGSVNTEGTPTVTITLAGQQWPAIIDTGFNSDLELPEQLRAYVNPRPLGRISSLFGGGQTIKEDLFEVDFPFDGAVVAAEATFVPGKDLLIGTRLLSRYRLGINHFQRTVELERVS